MAERILVIGSPGSGKSTLARVLAEQTGLPLYPLDQLYWQPGWVETQRPEFEARVAAITATPRWIIEGNYSGTLATRLARADKVVLLDLSPFRCTWRIVRRWLATRGRVRVDMAPGCPERLDLAFLWYVLSFRLRGLPRVEARLAGFGGELVWLGTPAEVRGFLSGELLYEDVHE
ncbi:topology modulation protein [Sphingomonas sp. HF-S4]|uniref:Topology modulation protein n=1 Tax=Sphingomonas agrestis TaxID=3080540 RepID=A0ABU3Y5S1_9SPHN|nr:AAA family ATPase [Sphingomonas sp. HF-S4]MDV3456447.1 topology modulation protein [Sphingomonas sp. HF-S4]